MWIYEYPRNQQAGKQNVERAQIQKRRVHKGQNSYESLEMGTPEIQSAKTPYFAKRPKSGK